jgi:catechol 2,3-dioxygenase-like lactoylglutathione lyase family enzyme
MSQADGSLSFYFFDVDDNLVFLSTKLYLWNAETQTEQAISSGEFAAIQSELGRPGPWQAWAVRSQTFRDFNDQSGIAPDQQTFVRDILSAAHGSAPWQGPSWPLIVHAAKMQRPIALVSARGHTPVTMQAGLQALVDLGLLAALPPILGIFTVTNPDVLTSLGITDPATTVPSAKKIALKRAVALALERYGATPQHRFGMSDDDPANVVLAISAMRDCKLEHPDKRFFVINTNGKEFVKLEIFPMNDPVTATDHLLDGVTSSEDDRGIGAATTSIYITDMDRAVNFYSESMGFRLTTRIGNEWAEFRTEQGFTIGLHTAEPPRTVPAGTSGAINLELQVQGDLDSAIATLKAHGVAFDGGIQNYEHVRLISLLDPDGNKLVLAQPI